MKNNNLLIGLISICLSSISLAGTSTTNPKATATLASSCQLSANNIEFGQINPAIHPYANNTMSVLCSKGVNYSILLDCGVVATGAHYTNGRPDACFLTGSVSGEHLAYGVQNFPVDTNRPGWTSTAVSGTGTGATQSLPMYGNIAYGVYGGLAYPTPDNYADTMTATISF